MTSHYTRGSVTTLHDFGGALGRPLDTFFWALTNLHGHGSWLVCELALSGRFSMFFVAHKNCAGFKPRKTIVWQYIYSFEIQKQAWSTLRIMID